MSDPKPISMEEFERRVAAFDKHVDATPTGGTAAEKQMHVLLGFLLLSGGEEALAKGHDAIADAVRASLKVPR